MLVFDLERQMCRHGVGQPARIVDARERRQNLGRYLHVEFDVLVELVQHRAHQRLAFLVGDRLGFEQRHLRREVTLGLVVALNHGTALALDQHLDGAVRQLQQLQDAGDRADGVDIVRRRVIIGGALLCRQHDLFSRLHRQFERADGFLPADEQRNHHVRKHDHVPQRQHRQRRFRTGDDSGREMLIGFLHFTLSM